MLKRRNVDERHASLLEVAYAKSGSWLKAARVMAFVIAWGTVRQELGREPSVDEYADWWKEPRSTAYRHLGEFREVFDRCETPAPVLDLMDQQRAKATDRMSWAALAA